MTFKPIEARLQLRQRAVGRRNFGPRTRRVRKGPVERPDDTNATISPKTLLTTVLMPRQTSHTHLKRFEKRTKTRAL